LIIYLSDYSMITARLEPRMQYSAFISYNSRDRRIATWLHRALERYRVPKRLHGRASRLGPVGARLPPVFRDRDELAASADLGEAIRAALANAATLIIICSPGAVASYWVNAEIRAFIALGRRAGSAASSSMASRIPPIRRANACRRRCSRRVAASRSPPICAPARTVAVTRCSSSSPASSTCRSMSSSSARRRGASSAWLSSPRRRRRALSWPSRSR
jgi:hypothetical protein